MKKIGRKQKGDDRISSAAESDDECEAFLQGQ